MEIDARFPSVQVNQAADARVGQASTPARLPVESDSKFLISPVLKFDSRSLTVIFQVRDSLSGDVVRQFPSEAVIARYRQDPTTKPFVLPSARGDGEPVEIKLASGSGSEAPRGATGDDRLPDPTAGSPGAEPARAAPVDLVA